DAFHLFHVAFAQVVDSIEYVFLGESLLAKGFGDDLQVRHARDLHLGKASGSTKHSFEHWDRVVLESAGSRGTNQSPVDVPEKHAQRGRRDGGTRIRGDR